MAKTKENIAEQPVEVPVEQQVEASAEQQTEPFVKVEETPDEQQQVELRINEDTKDIFDGLSSGLRPVDIVSEQQTVEVVVLKRFIDKYNHKTWYNVGSKVTFDKARAEDVIGRGLAKLAK